jgi:hypothetical protein
MVHLFARPLRMLALCALIVCVTALSALADISGGYYVYGRNADGSAYDGTLQIVPNGNGTYGVNWQVGTAYAGVGTLTGDIFTVNWGDLNPAFYIVMPDGELHGTWADGTGLELLTRTPR